MALQIFSKWVKNFKQGRDGRRPEMIVIHIADGYRESVLSEFTNNEKSSTYLVNRDGTVWQFVEEKDTAFGNGIVYRPTSWEVMKRAGINPNLYTISIEHEGLASEDLTDVQYRASAELIADIAKRHQISLDRNFVIGHREIRRDKECPGKINIDKLLRLAQNPTERENQEKISRLQQILVDLLRQLRVLQSKQLGGMKYSITQGGILAAFVGLIVTQTGWFTDGCAGEVTNLIVPSLGLVAAWLGRWRVGDITLAGFRK